MEARLLVVVLVLPFLGIFVYATWHEYNRYKREGPSRYGLTYDPETNSTHAGPIADGDESFDPSDYLSEPGATGTDTDPDHPTEDDNEQDNRS